jgi:translation initiation factor 2B subunit (eIF-2B alpha/beta/delta family)
MHPSINQIASNSTSGAAEILRLAGEVFAQLRFHQSDLCQGSVEQAQKAIFETSIALVRAQPDMSPLLRLASVAISAATTATSAQDALKSAEDQALKFIENAERAGRRAALHAANLILNGTTVMTHSRSSTVLTALVQAKLDGRDFSVVATESRPGLEGRTLAQALALQDIHVSLIADPEASLAMSDVDVVLVGADTITQEVLVNKIGTRMLGLAARERGLPFYAVCDTSKFINGEYWRRPVRGEGSVNYFEATPLAQFTGIITEEGVLSSEEAARRAERASIDKQLSDALEELRQQIR